jgi:predicted AAA+ superfamily ATPase
MDTTGLLARIADALDRFAPLPPAPADPNRGDSFVWENGRLRTIAPPAAQPLARFIGVDTAKAMLLANTDRHAQGLPAHDVLLWGSRGMGKSSLVRSVHRELAPKKLGLVQVARDDISSLPSLFRQLDGVERRFLIFADDLSFEADEHQYKALRSVLDGGIEARPDNVRIVVTSNRRHLIAREHADAEAAAAVNARDLLDDRLALADRFGLSLGFHNCDQPTYLAMIHGYAEAYRLAVDDGSAVAWALTRGNRSGRVAWQYIQEVAGAAGVSLG